MTESDPALLDRLPEAVLIVRDGTIVLANDRARVLLWASGSRDPAWPVGDRFADVARLQDEAGNEVVLPSDPPPVGDRCAERVVFLEAHGHRRPLAMAARWSGGELTVTLRGAGRRVASGRLQSDAVATVAHEIRSPLTSVKGFTRTLLKRWDRFSDEQKQVMLATIEQDADRVTRLLTDLLDVSRIDAGRVVLKRSEVDLVELVHAVVAKARMRGSEARMDVKVDGTVPRISADRDKLEQVLTNLLDNALRHAPGSPVTVGVGLADQRVRVSVSDRGPGIDPALAGQLFRKFGRTGAHRVGTGLGLFLTRGLVEAHGGRTWFDPDVQTGATIHVELPLTAP